jgi:hypothetical protein
MKIPLSIFLGCITGAGTVYVFYVFLGVIMGEGFSWLYFFFFWDIMFMLILLFNWLKNR